MPPPGYGNAPGPDPETPDDIRVIYEEARAVLAFSPRAAGALLRLALERLLGGIRNSEKKLDTMIGDLVKEGLLPDVQKAADTLRITGNDVLHAGEMAESESTENVAGLFGLFNHVVDELIGRPKRIASFYGALPEKKLEGIENRDRERKEPEVRS